MILFTFLALLPDSYFSKGDYALGCNWGLDCTQVLDFPKISLFHKILTESFGNLCSEFLVVTSVSLVVKEKDKKKSQLFCEWLYSEKQFSKLFHDGGRYHTETSSLICSGFYMIMAFVFKKRFKRIVNKTFIWLPGIKMLNIPWTLNLGRTFIRYKDKEFSKAKLKLISHYTGSGCKLKTLHRFPILLEPCPSRRKKLKRTKN